MTRRTSTRPQRFRAEIELGHKGSAVIVPFDPEKVWGIAPVKVLRQSMGHFVSGSMNGVAFEGFIGHRWGRFFVMVDDAMQKATGTKPGDSLDVVVSPKKSVARRSSAR